MSTIIINQKLENNAQKYAFFSFLGMFPGLFLIYSFISFNGSGGQYSGLSGIMAIGCIILLALPSWNKLSRLSGKSQLLVLSIHLYIFYVALCALIFFLFDSELPQAYIVYTLTYLMYVYTFLLIGFNYKPNYRQCNLILSICFYFMFLYIVTNIDPQRSIFSVGSESDNGVVSYQGFGRYFIGVALSLIAINTFRIRILIASVSTIGLFFLGSRSDLFGFIFISPLFFINFSSASKTFLNYITIFFASILLIGVVLLNGQVNIIEKFQNNRAMEITELSSSSSWQSRTNLQEQAVTAIKEHPIVGDYGGQLKATGSIGNFAHNFISAWRQFGLIGFLLFTSITVYSLIVPFKATIIYKMNSPFIQLALFVNLYSVFLLLISKPVFWFFVALGWGLSVAVQHTIKKNDL